MSPAIALIEPRIPPNTGNVARLCAATGSSLHLVGPLGFDVDDAGARRAGLDYWDRVDLWVHSSLNEFRRAISRERCLYFSAHGSRSYLEAPYAQNSVLVFGSETKGLPPQVAAESDRVFRVPMLPGVRNLNLATSVGIVAYEALRQMGVELDGGGERRVRALRVSRETNRQTKRVIS